MENIPFCGGEGVGGDLQCDCLNSKMPFYEVSLSLFFLTPSGRGLYNGHGSIGRGGRGWRWSAIGSCLDLMASLFNCSFFLTVVFFFFHF